MYGSTYSFHGCMYFFPFIIKVTGFSLNLKNELKSRPDVKSSNLVTLIKENLNGSLDCFGNDEVFCQNSQQLIEFNYFRENLCRECSTRS